MLRWCIQSGIQSIQNGRIDDDCSFLRNFIFVARLEKENFNYFSFILIIFKPINCVKIGD